MQPNVRRKWTAGLAPCQASYDILPKRLHVGARLRRKTAVETVMVNKRTQEHRVLGSPCVCSNTACVRAIHVHDLHLHELEDMCVEEEVEQK